MRHERQARLLCIHVAKFSMESQPQPAFLARHDLGRMPQQTLAHLFLKKRRDLFATALRVVDTSPPRPPHAPSLSSADSCPQAELMLSFLRYRRSTESGLRNTICLS